ncbi:hypothetical protein EBZ39_03255 [bacterium]|nr:hypothetical protein [bacterium]
MNSQIEAAFAEWLGGLVNNAPIHTASSSDEINPSRLAIVVSVPTLEHLVDPLHKATVEVVLAGPAFNASLSSYRNAASSILTAIQSRAFSGLVTALEPFAAFAGLHLQESSESQGDDTWTHTIRVVCGLMTDAEAEPWPDDQGTADSFTAGATMSGGRFVYLSGDAAMYANAATSLPAMGYIRGAVVSGDTVTVYRQGRLDGLAGLTADADYYLGANGQITTSPGTSAGIIQFLGRSISTTSLLVEIDSPIAIE